MSHQTPSAVVTSAAPTIARRLLRSAGMSLLFALLLWAAAAAGRIPIPGTPVAITLQTFVLMLAAWRRDWREALGVVASSVGSGVSSYISRDARYRLTRQSYIQKAVVPTIPGGGLHMPYDRRCLGDACAS